MADKKSLAVIAFGGNALAPDSDHLSVDCQYRVVRTLSATLVDLMESGWNVIVTHGNGPQIGVVMRRIELTRHEVTPATLDYAGAYTQGSIGYMFSMALQSEFRKRGLKRQALAMISETLVDAADPAFANPSKPIGSWYEKTRAEHLARANRWSIVEDAGRGWRRIVPSPRPIGIIQIPAIQALLREDITIVTLGGGGIPVIQDETGELTGVEAVIDKDFASSLLAREIRADLLLFPTAVPKVALRFNRPDQRWLDRMSIAEARAACERGEFSKGGMEPKIRALMEFVDATGNPGVITNIENLAAAMRGEAGTRLVR